MLKRPDSRGSDWCGTELKRFPHQSSSALSLIWTFCVLRHWIQASIGTFSAGEGPTAQAAKHSAASKALKSLREMPVPDGKSKLDPTSQPFVPGRITTCESLISWWLPILFHCISCNKVAQVPVPVPVVNYTGTWRFLKHSRQCHVFCRLW